MELHGQTNHKKITAFFFSPMCPGFKSLRPSVHRGFGPRLSFLSPSLGSSPATRIPVPISAGRRFRLDSKSLPQTYENSPNPIWIGRSLYPPDKARESAGQAHFSFFKAWAPAPILARGFRSVDPGDGKELAESCRDDDRINAPRSSSELRRGRPSPECSGRLDRNRRLARRRLHFHESRVESPWRCRADRLGGRLL